MPTLHWCVSHLCIYDGKLEFSLAKSYQGVSRNLATIVQFAQIILLESVSFFHLDFPIINTNLHNF